MTDELERLRQAAANPAECFDGCECLCHGDTADVPGKHLATCAWADPNFPEYVWAAAQESKP